MNWWAVRITCGGKVAENMQALTRPIGQVSLNLAHVGVETHRQHAVGLVEDENLQFIEHQCAFEQMVEDAPRRADDDVRALFERVDLRAVADAAVDRHRAQPGAPHSTSASCQTWCASSRVGTRISAWVVALQGSSRSSIGSRKAPVLPLPVRAWIITSWPSSRKGIAAPGRA
jgi:hypothetical protein